ncbi:MAG: hypothetical protein ABI609_06595 [Acidobacteriota bacterium]
MRSALLVLLVICAAASAAAADSADSTRGLADRARQHFEVLPLREGVLLKPHAGGSPGYSVIEITESGVAVDGEELSGSKLRRRLGADSDLVEAIADLDGEDLRALAGSARELAVGAPASPELPVPPSPPTPPSAPISPTPPSAPLPPMPPRHRSTDAKISLGSSSHVARGETSDDVVVIGGTINVEGEVFGDAIAVGGSVRIDGKVTGDVVAVGGGVELGPHADVYGDVTSVGGHVERDPSAQVRRSTNEVAMGPFLSLGRLGRFGRHRVNVDFDPFAHAAALFSGGLRLVLLSIFACLMMLIARRPLENVAAKVVDEPWRSGLIGLLAQILVVPLFFITLVVLLVSVIGIPLIVLLPFAMLALIVGAFLGYAAVAWRLGAWVERRFGWTFSSPYVALIVGVLCIQAMTLVGRAMDWGFSPLGFFVGLLLFAGWVVQYAVWTVGFGAVLITRFGTYAVWRGWRWHRPESPPVEAPRAAEPLSQAPELETTTAPPPPPPADETEPGL